MDDIKEKTECKNCGNIYEIIWLEEGEEYNDFGYRYCPFCGSEIDLYN